jgi:hypothetical protein
VSEPEKKTLELVRRAIIDVLRELEEYGMTGPAHQRASNALADLERIMEVR